MTSSAAASAYKGIDVAYLNPRNIIIVICRVSMAYTIHEILTY